MAGRAITSESREQSIETVCRMLREGHSRGTACRVAGIARDTLYRWTRADEELRLRVEHAAGEGERGYVEDVRRHRDDDWRAAAWLLERISPDFSAKLEHQVNVRQDEPDISRLSDETKSALLEVLERAAVELENGNGHRKRLPGGED